MRALVCQAWFYQYVNSTGSCSTRLFFPFPGKTDHFFAIPLFNWIFNHVGPFLLSHGKTVSLRGFAERLWNIFGQPSGLQVISFLPASRLSPKMSPNERAMTSLYKSCWFFSSWTSLSLCLFLVFSRIVSSDVHSGGVSVTFLEFLISPLDFFLRISIMFPIYLLCVGRFKSGLVPHVSSPAVSGWSSKLLGQCFLVLWLC